MSTPGATTVAFTHVYYCQPSVPGQNYNSLPPNRLRSSKSRANSGLCSRFRAFYGLTLPAYNLGNDLRSCTAACQAATIQPRASGVAAPPWVPIDPSFVVCPERAEHPTVLQRHNHPCHPSYPWSLPQISDRRRPRMPRIKIKHERPIVERGVCGQGSQLPLKPSLTHCVQGCAQDFRSRFRASGSL